MMFYRKQKSIWEPETCFKYVLKVNFISSVLFLIILYIYIIIF